MSCHRNLSLVLTTAATFLLAASAQAIYVDFADYQGAASGNTATIYVEDQTIDITAMPTDFDLTISRDGLGVKCTDGFWNCFGNQGRQIDAEWGEEITITFQDAVTINSVDLSLLYEGEVAVVGTSNGAETLIKGDTQYLSGDRGIATVELGGVGVTELTFSARYIFSDFSLKGIDFTPGVVSEPGNGGPTTAVPEPSAALIFAAGFGVAALHGRGRRRR
jgi:hypothetical protein